MLAEAEEAPPFLAFEFWSHREGAAFRRAFWEVRGSARPLPSVEAVIGPVAAAPLVARARRASRRGWGSGGPGG